ncbi:glycosyltransferase [Candidatus Woesearchaeota archaeon]|nr:glycosyltransferase [Candidatus Woesearchaeota archaeon]
MTDISVIIPAFNRIDSLKHSLQSVRKAVKNLNYEIIVVDDGSDVPLSEQMKEFNELKIKHIRQKNQGPLFARLKGLENAEGKYIQFLDSDDIIAINKLEDQIKLMNSKNLDVSYTDYQNARRLKSGDIEITSNVVYEESVNSDDLFMKIQPVLNTFVFKKKYLDHCMNNLTVKASDKFSYAADDKWFLFNLSVNKARVEKLKGFYNVVVNAEGLNLSKNWEKLTMSSTLLIKEFVDNCSDDNINELLGELAFHLWRIIPKEFKSEIKESLLDCWLKTPAVNSKKLGGQYFNLISKILGPINTAYLFSYFKKVKYSKYRTMTDEEIYQYWNNLIK